MFACVDFHILVSMGLIDFLIQDSEWPDVELPEPIWLQFYTV